MSIPVQDRLIVALDVPDAAAAGRLVDRLGPAATFYKIGLELIYGGDGLALAERLIGAGKKVFLDCKLHDIPNTVAAATTRIRRLGAAFLTVHAYPQTMRAAQEAAAGSDLRLLAVTVLTSADDRDLEEAGYGWGTAALVRRRAQQAGDCGLHGLVLSPHEVAETRALVGPRIALVTPGVRPAGSDTADQKRVMTPDQAIRAGADHLVIGRPITAAPDPAAAHAAILATIAAAADPPP